MYIQWFVKGIAGETSPGAADGISQADAFALLSSGYGIMSNWLRTKPARSLAPDEIGPLLTDANLDRHLHDYSAYGSRSPFISLAVGAVERNRMLRMNGVYSAIDTALSFATEDWNRPGALVFGWTVVSLNPAVAVLSVAEAVGELNVYRRWSPFQLEGEITAKLFIPANQIQRIEWWDSGGKKGLPSTVVHNTSFADPKPVTNVRHLF